MYGAGRELALARVRAPDGRTAAILPLYRADRGPSASCASSATAPPTRPGRCARPPTARSPRPRCAASARGARPARAAARRAAGRRRSRAAGARRRARCAREPSPVLAIDGAGLGRLARDARARTSAARCAAWSASWPATTTCASGSPTTRPRCDADLETLFRLHDAALGGRGRDGRVQRGPPGVPPRLRRPRARGGAGCGCGSPRSTASPRPRLVRPAPRRAATGTTRLGRDPAWDRDEDRLRPARPHDPRGVRGRHGGVPLRPRRRGVQGPLRHDDPELVTAVAGHPLATRAVSAGIGAARRLPDGPRRLIARRAG